MPSYSRTVAVSGKSAKELYETVEASIDRFLEKTSIGKFDLERDPTHNEVRFKSSMFSGTLVCAEGSLCLTGSLSFLATPFRSKIDDGIDRWVAKTFFSDTRSGGV